MTFDKMRIRLAGLGACAVLLAGTAVAAAPPAGPAPSVGEAPKSETPWMPEAPAVPAERLERGAKVYTETCAACHEAGMARAPSPYILRLLPPAAIHRALTTGAMREVGQALPADDRAAVAEYLSGRPLGGPPAEPPLCQGSAAEFNAGEPPAFGGWGLTPGNTRHVGAATAGLNAQNVGRLRLKWAFGFEGSSRVRSQPAFAGGAIYVGSEDGRVFALDRNTGCRRWTYQAGAEVRTGIVVSQWKAGDRKAQPLLYFGDVVGYVYAVNARTGALVWRDRADAHPSTTLTAAPALHQGRLYVPVSSLEEGVAGAGYACCSFRGSVVAYDARKGNRLWQTYLVGEPKPVGKSVMGTQLLGPSGVALWNTPAIDAKRGQLTVATGDDYSSPATKMSDAVVAMDLRSGRIKWVHQALEGDAWNVSCAMPDRSNCPEEDGPDYDFGAASILVTARDGRQYLLAGQKSGDVYAFDPRDGKQYWKRKVGRGGILAGVYFGMATGSDRVYVPINDAPDGRNYTDPARPGVYALDLHTGKTLWEAPNGEATCKERGPQCWGGVAAAITSTDDLVIAGAGDGWLRIHDAATGKVVWQYDTMQEVATVTGGKAKGGSMGGGNGPVVWGGTLVMGSGYAFAGRMPGNVLLVFGVE